MQEVVISGIKFNVPDGYNEDISKREVNSRGSDGNYFSSCRVYEKEDDVVAINVAKYTHGEMDEEGLEKLSKTYDSELININGISAYLAKVDDVNYNLMYVQFNKLIVLTSKNKDSFKNFARFNESEVEFGEDGNSEVSQLIQKENKRAKQDLIAYGIMELLFGCVLLYFLFTLGIGGNAGSSIMKFLSIIIIIYGIYSIIKGIRS